MTTGHEYYVENKEKFKGYQVQIDAYNEQKEQDMKLFDEVFYERCKSLIPNEVSLDSEAIDGSVYVWKLLNENELTIVNEYTIKDLTDKQLSGELKAHDIAVAYIKAAIVAQHVTNCVLQFLIPEALEKARELDAYVKENGKLSGPLHGIPVSLKEQMFYKGKITHASYCGYIDNIPDDSALSIQILDKLGAIFHVRTSQPQAIMHLDTWNNINGRTRNPLATKLSPGGSSGGESACVGMHGSVIGHGSDIGGSIRCPAAFVNLFGLRPTTKRLSLVGGLSGGKGQESVVATQGPLARSIDELELYMDAYINQGRPWERDAATLPIPWRKPVLPEIITIGVLAHDNLVTPYPSITRGMHEVVESLKNDPRFKIVDLSKYWYTEEDMKDIISTTESLYTCDGNKTQLGMFEKSGEPILPLTKCFLEFGGGKEHDVVGNRMMNAKRDQWKNELLNTFFNDLHIDFILSPTNVAPAEIPGESYYWGYTAIWNLLDYPNVVFPTGIKHDVAIDSTIPDLLRENEYEKKVWYNADGSIRYKGSNYLNAPVALQLTGKRFCDEDVVAATKCITQVLGVKRV